MYITRFCLSNPYSKNANNPIKARYKNPETGDQISFSGGIQQMPTRKKIMAGIGILVSLLMIGKGAAGSGNKIDNDIIQEPKGIYQKHNGNKFPNIVVIDSFQKNLDLNKDGKSDISHGEIIVSQINKYRKDINLIKYDDKNGDVTATEEAINDVLNRINNGEKISAMNLSLSIPVKIDRLSEITGKELTPDNLYIFKDEIVAALANHIADPSIKGVISELAGIDKKVAIIRKIEALSNKGVRVYISAGNSGKDSINILNLANGVFNVAAAENGKIADYSCYNSLVNRKEQGTIKITPLAKNNEFIGYDTNEDGKVDISASEISDKRIPANNLPDERKAVGTSSSAAIALSKALAKK